MKRNVTLVAQYADQKEKHFRAFLEYCIQKAKTVIPNFKEYDVAQVHGTVMQMEAVEEGGCIYNEYYRACNPKSPPLDFQDIFNHLRKLFGNPIKVRFGGFRLDRDVPFKPEDHPLTQHPYYRSFYLGNEQPASGTIVGWPKDKHETLDQIRKNFENVRIMEKWTAKARLEHKPERKSFDFFCVIGHVGSSFGNPFALADGAAQMRSFLAALDGEIQWVRECLGPVDVTLSRETLALVRYQHRTLPLASTEVLPLTEVTTPEQLEHLYRK